MAHAPSSSHVQIEIARDFEHQMRHLSPLDQMAIAVTLVVDFVTQQKPELRYQVSMQVMAMISASLAGLELQVPRAPTNGA